MGDITSPRRYYHRERMNARALGNPSLEGTWRAKQEACAGTTLPDGFPYLAQLKAAGYECIEDLNGADLHELERIAQLTRREAHYVLDAYAMLIAPPSEPPPSSP